MKKRMKTRLVLLIAFVISVLPPVRAAASQATSYTYTMDNKGSMTRTQDAYLPDKTISNLGLSMPEDLFIDSDNMLYIADSGNARIVKYSIKKAEVVENLTCSEFQKPTGIYVTKNGDIYVADTAAKKVFRFDRNFKLTEAFSKPDSPIFSDTKFQPSKISVGNNGEMYIVGEGVYSGIIQLSASGEFLGYFAVNRTELSVVQAFQNAIFTRKQLANLAERVPTTFSNIFVDQSNIVYTTTMGTKKDGLKKHDTAGGNMLQGNDPCSDKMTDIWVDKYGIIYTSDAQGYINIYSNSGDLIFSFGSKVSDLDVSGLYTSLPAVTVDRDGHIWTVDGEKGYLQSFAPAEYAEMIYGAITLYEEGKYQESQDKWEAVLRLNQMSVLAHNGVGKAYLYAEHYEDAMEHFEVAGNRKFYSQAFWEIRNTWIQKWLPVAAVVIFLLWLISFVIRKLDKNHTAAKAKKKIIHAVMESPVLGDVLYALRIAVHPIDRYYDIRVRQRGTLTGATIIYTVFFLTYMAYQTKKGFIYQTKAVEDMDINAIVIGFFAILGLFILCNFLVASIQDGDGSLKQVYMIPAYGAVPALLSMLSVTLLSHVLTTNEAFLLDIIMNIGIIWSIILIFTGLMTVHEYTARETVVSLIITAIFIIVIAVISIIIIIMWDQLWEFIKTIGKEMAQNAVR